MFSVLLLFFLFVFFFFFFFFVFCFFLFSLKEADIPGRFTNILVQRRQLLRLPVCFPAHQAPSEKASTLKGNTLIPKGAVISFKTLRKHAYLNILKISPPKSESFQIEILIFSYFLSKHRLWVLVRTASPRRF